LPAERRILFTRPYRDADEGASEEGGLSQLLLAFAAALARLDSASNGTPLAVVSERLGHANQNITLGVYSHSLPADRKAASKVWHSALSEDDLRRLSPQNRAKSRKVSEIGCKC